MKFVGEDEAAGLLEKAIQVWCRGAKYSLSLS